MTALLNILALFSPLSISGTQITYAIIAVIFLYTYKERKIILKNPYFKLFVVLFILMVITSLTGINPKKSLSDVKQSTLILTFIPAYYLMNKQRLKFFIFFLLIGVIISVIYGQLVYDTDRLSGAFKSPVSFGNLMVFICLASIFILFHLKELTNKEKIIFSILLLFSVVTLFLTRTRGAIIAFIFTSIIAVTYLLIRGNTKKRYTGAAILLIGIFLSAIAAIYLSSNITVTFKEAITKWHDPTTSFGWRLVLWKESWRVFLENPLLGIGAGNIKSVFNTAFEYKHQSIAHCHNMYLQVLVDYGLFGALVLISIYAKLAKDSFSEWRKGSNFGFCNLIFIAALCVEGISESCMFDSEITMLFWFLAGAFLKVATDENIIQDNKTLQIT